MARRLIVTNDFPPRRGGIETFVYEVARRFPAVPSEQIVVYTSAEPGAAEFDRGLPFPVVRDRARTLLPTARVARTARRRFGLEGRPVVLTVSRLVARKGQDRLIRAMPRVREAVPGATLLIVGGGPREARLRDMAGDGVVFAGSVPHADLPPYYAAADAFALPCRSRRFGLETEGLGIVFLEAAAAGLPALAGDSGGAPETVRHGETGYVVDPASVDEIAARLVDLLVRPGAMGEKGRVRARDEWSWNGTYQAFRRFTVGA